LQSELLPISPGAAGAGHHMPSPAAPARVRCIRAWRQAAHACASPLGAAYTLLQSQYAHGTPASAQARRNLARALRRERSRAGGPAYDLNRHIALARAMRDLGKTPLSASKSPRESVMMDR
jgi:hypothetical protein